jgi:hypothetical protein
MRVYACVCACVRACAHRRLLTETARCSWRRKSLPDRRHFWLSGYGEGSAKSCTRTHAHTHTQTHARTRAPLPSISDTNRPKRNEVEGGREGRRGARNSLSLSPDPLQVRVSLRDFERSPCCPSESRPCWRRLRLPLRARASVCDARARVWCLVG